MQEHGDQLQRLFLAVRLPSPVVAALEELPRTGEAGVRWVAPEQWHITVRFFASAAPVDVIAATSTVMPPPALALPLGPLVTTLGSAVIVPASGLDELAADLLDATRTLAPVDRRPFVGHVTLGRLRRSATCQLVGHRVEASFTLERVELIASEQTANGHRYETLHAWPAIPGH